ncbi:UNVERIFIED_CONTAM: VOC family protein, partial [Prevotella sp. 15_C9]
MKKLIAFFEIPATDFRRAIDFYETVLNMKLPTCECEEEKMAFFTEGDEFVGAVSCASDFLPSEKGGLIHFNVDE